MRLLRTIALSLIALVATACAGAETTLTTLDEVLGETASNMADAIAEAQEEMADIGQEIEQSEAAEDLRQAWEDLQADLSAFFTSLQAEERIDTEHIQQILDDFEQQLDQAGDQVTPELRDAWESLRAHIERLLDQAG
jgi:Sec-independent protein translocase protein TatA